ncbi:MAG: hypothetical protein U1E46_16620 [Hyphomicrobiales bacterium]
MTMIRKILLGSLAALGVAVAAQMAHEANVPGVPSFVSPAEAIIGRPLTPVSVAGVARRTVRRCAVGVYYC